MITELILAITGLMSAVFAFIKWLLPYIQEKIRSNKLKAGSNKFNQGLRALLRVNDIMEELRQHKHITRVLLLEISNGGDNPKPGSNIFATAIQVRKDDTVGDRDVPAEKDLKEKYDRVLLDDAYVEMLLSLSRNGVYKMRVSEAEACLLRDFYIMEEIQYSEIYRIHVDPDAKKMFILSVATDEDGKLFNSAPTRAFINSAVTTVQSLFEAYRDS